MLNFSPQSYAFSSKNKQEHIFPTELLGKINTFPTELRAKIHTFPTELRFMSLSILLLLIYYI